MAVQKQAVLELVKTHRGEGRSVGEVLGSVGVARSSYYRWKKSETFYELCQAPVIFYAARICWRAIFASW